MIGFGEVQRSQKSTGGVLASIEERKRSCGGAPPPVSKVTFLTDDRSFTCYSHTVNGGKYMAKANRVIKIEEIFLNDSLSENER